jgi:A1 cistron-splicing factor AAR2
VVVTIAAQIQSIPSGSFETELPEFDLFYLDEIESLRANLASAPWREQVIAQWKRLQAAGKTWRWDIDGLEASTRPDESDEEDEEGEYAPVVVEL